MHLQWLTPGIIISDKNSTVRDSDQLSYFRHSPRSINPWKRLTEASSIIQPDTIQAASSHTTKFWTTTFVRELWSINKLESRHKENSLKRRKRKKKVKERDGYLSFCSWGRRKKDKQERSRESKGRSKKSKKTERYYIWATAVDENSR